MRRLLSILMLAFALLAMTSSDNYTHIYIIGDSTAAEKKNPETNPERGWGMVFQGCLDDQVLVHNFAVNGRSSKSFIAEGRWQDIMDKLQPGDYVFIQFGHNDEKKDQVDRYTTAGGTFDKNLERFCKDAQAKGAIPVLFSPVVRRNFLDKKKLNKAVKLAGEDDDEKLRNNAYKDDEEKVNSDTLIDTHKDYRFSAGNVAKKMGVAYVDACTITKNIENKLGVKGSRKLHMWFKPGEVSSIPQGRKDNTHYSVYGAHVVANALADEIGAQVPALKRHIRHYDYVVSKKGRGNYMDLQKAVDEAPENVETKILVLGGFWPKPNIPKTKNIKFTLYFGAVIR